MAGPSAIRDAALRQSGAGLAPPHLMGTGQHVEIACPRARVEPLASEYSARHFSIRSMRPGGVSTASCLRRSSVSQRHLHPRRAREHCVILFDDCTGGTTFLTLAAARACSTKVTNRSEVIARRRQHRVGPAGASETAHCFGWRRKRLTVIGPERVQAVDGPSPAADVLVSDVDRTSPQQEERRV